MRLTHRTPSRRPRWRPCLAALACGLLLGTAQAAPLREVADPHYGDVLFEFYQDRYFQAITGLMVSQHFGRVPHHADEAEVLRGGMLLSYGMQQAAGDIFERLIAMGATPATRDRAWYFLARIRFQRGYVAEAAEALARIGDALEPAMRPERGLLQAQVQMAQGDFAAAARTLSALDSQQPDARYVRFNLGVALIRSGEAARGTAVLDALGQLPAENEEYRDLRDRANVALGFAALSAGQLPQARTWLERVRLNALQSNRALLGLGWANAQAQAPRTALVPWLELMQRDISESAVLEAWIAAPYAYAELGAWGQAASGYEQAIAVFAQESAALDGTMEWLRTGALVQQLVKANPGNEMGWFWNLRELPTLPHPRQLAHVMAQHDFQEALKNYRDLLFLERNLQEWIAKLDSFDDMLANRRKAFAERLPQVRQRAAGLDATALRQRLGALQAEVEAGATAADGVAFADAREAALLARVQRVREALPGLPATPATPGMDAVPAAGDAATLAGVADGLPPQERLRLAAGALTWSLAQALPERLWQARSALQKSDAGLVRAQSLEEALARAEREEPQRFAAFAARIAALRPQLPQQLQRVAALRDAQLQALEQLAVADLQRQQQQIAQYSTQAHFALAQLYDRASGVLAPPANPVVPGATASSTTAPEAGHADKP